MGEYVPRFPGPAMGPLSCAKLCAACSHSACACAWLSISIYILVCNYQPEPRAAACVGLTPFGDCEQGPVVPVPSVVVMHVLTLSATWSTSGYPGTCRLRRPSRRGPLAGPSHV
jgi:hypothetical protein